MSLLFMDGFDHYGLGAVGWTILQAEHWVGAFTVDSTQTSATARNGYSLHFTHASGWLRSPTFTPTRTLYVGFAMRRGDLGNATVSRYFLRLFDSVGDEHCHLSFNEGGYIFLARNTTLAVTSDVVISLHAWHFYDIYIKIGQADGEVLVKVDGVEVLNATEIDTQINAADNTCAQFALGTSYNPSYYFDDLWVDNAQSHGDCRVDTSYPDADGTTTDFALSGGSTHWELLDETPPDDDATYTESNTVTDLELLGFPAVAVGGGDIIGVALHAHTKKDDAGDRGIKIRAYSNSTTSDSAEKGLSTDYVGYSHIWEVDPDTSSAWTEGGVNAAEFGILVES